MTNTGVKNYSNVQNVTKNISSNYSYAQKSSANAASKAFGNLMQNSMNKTSDMFKTKTIQEKMSTRRSQVEYIVRGARHTGDGKAVDESVMTGSLKALTSEVKAVVCAVLDVTDEELERLLAESGMCITDLLSQNNLADFVSQALADGDALKLLTDSSISEKFTQLSDDLKAMLADAANELGISADELAGLMQDANVNPADESINSALETVNDGNGSDKAGSNAENLQDNANIENADVTGAKLEEKVTISSDKNSSDSMSGGGNESLSSQFLETLMGNVDNVVAGTSDNNAFEGYTVRGEDIVRQLVDAIRVNVNSSFSEMELQLQPENLGKLNLLISSRDGIITAQLMAENDDVKNAIENQLVMLKDNFEQQGLKVDAVEVTVQSHGFETGKNLEGRNESSQDDGGHRSSRQLTLEQINAIIGDDEVTDEDLLAAEMMRATGGNVDYMV